MSEQQLAEQQALELVERLRVNGVVHASRAECAEAATRVGALLETFPSSAVLADHYACALWALNCHERPPPEMARWIASLEALWQHVPTSLAVARTLTNMTALASAELPTVDARLAGGSHLRGRWPAEELAVLRPDQFTEIATGSGDVLLLRPLLVHPRPPSSPNGGACCTSSMRASTRCRCGGGSDHARARAAVQDRELVAKPTRQPGRGPR